MLVMEKKSMVLAMLMSQNMEWRPDHKAEWMARRSSQPGLYNHHTDDLTVLI